MSRTRTRSVVAATAAPIASTQEFAALLEESLSVRPTFTGRVVKGTIVRIENDFAVIDVGLKSEGRVLVKEFAPTGQAAEVKAGDLVDVFVERYEDKDGLVRLSREKARREEAWDRLE